MCSWCSSNSTLINPNDFHATPGGLPASSTLIDIGDWRFTVLENDDVLRIERIRPGPH